MKNAEKYQLEDLAMIRHYANQIENAAIACYITHPAAIESIQECLIGTLKCLRGREAYRTGGCSGDGDCPPGWVCADGYCTPKTRMS